MTEPPLSARDIFLLNLRQDDSAVTTDWSAVMQVIQDWSRDWGLELMDGPVKGNAEGEGFLLRIRPGNLDLMQAMAGLHHRLYDMRINLELEQQ